MREAKQVKRVVTTRRLATGLLMMMSVVFVVASRREGESPGWAYLAAFAEAAMVGALADWFAVTALFRHPLGIPIAHTAIIPNNKDRIADSLADFLENNFMTSEVLSEELGQIDFADLMVRWLLVPGQSEKLAARLLGSLPASFAMLQDAQIRQFVLGGVQTATSKLKLAPILGELLSVLVAEGRHQPLFDLLLVWAAQTLERHRLLVFQKVVEKSPRWLPGMFDAHLAKRLVDETLGLLVEMREPESDWREKFSHTLEDWIIVLKTSEDLEQKIQVIMQQTLHHPLWRSYLGRVMDDVAKRVTHDIARPDSCLQDQTGQLLKVMAEALALDPPMCTRINQGLQEMGTSTIARLRSQIVDLIRRVVRKWDAVTVSRKIEGYVGCDLQYIRINGTLVGGLVGLLLHGVRSFV